MKDSAPCSHSMREEIADLRSAMKALAAHIAPKVYEYGFLKG